MQGRCAGLIPGVWIGPCSKQSSCHQRVIAPWCNVQGGLTGIIASVRVSADANQARNNLGVIVIHRCRMKRTQGSLGRRIQFCPRVKKCIQNGRSLLKAAARCNDARPCSSVAFGSAPETRQSLTCFAFACSKNSWVFQLAQSAGSASAFHEENARTRPATDNAAKHLLPHSSFRCVVI